MNSDAAPFRPDRRSIIRGSVSCFALGIAAGQVIALLLFGAAYFLTMLRTAGL